MYFLFVDTETTGIPVDDSKTYKDIDNWPQIRQISWIMYTKSGNFVRARNYVTMSDNDTPQIACNGYLPKINKQIYDILPVFLEDLSFCDVVIGHNIDYDITIILCELYRLGLDTMTLESMQRFCTMKNGVDLCGFDSIHGDRYPKLQELYSKLFHHPFENPHDAYCDTLATVECFWEIVSRGNMQNEAFPYLMPDKERLGLAKKYAEEADAILIPERSSINRKRDEDDLMMQLNYLRERERKQLWGFSTDKIDARFRREYEAKYGTIDKLPTSVLSIKTSYQRADEARIAQAYKRQVALHEKAALLGYPYSMFRVGHLYYYNLNNEEGAIDWYIRAIKNGYNSPDCYFEYANLCVRLYGDRSMDGSKYYSKWVQMCEKQFDTISRRNLDLLIDAFEDGKYGQAKDINRAIDICRQAISQNRPEFGRLKYKYGVRYRLASLLFQNGDKNGASEQYTLYLQELNEYGEKTIHYNDVVRMIDALK